KTTDKILAATGLRGQGPELRRKLVRALQDQYIDLKSVMQDLVRKGGAISAANNVYQKITLFSGKVGHSLDAFNRKYVEPLEEHLEAAIQKGATLKDVEEFLIARHAPERNAMIAQRTGGKRADGSGMSDAQAAQTLPDYARTPYAAELQSIGKIAD